MIEDVFSPLSSILCSCGELYQSPNERPLTAIISLLIYHQYAVALRVVACAMRTDTQSRAFVCNSNIPLATNLYFSHTLQTHTPPMRSLQALMFDGLKTNSSVLRKTSLVPVVQERSDTLLCYRNSM